MGAGDLAPDAAVVRAAALGLGLVHVRHPLPAVPRHLLLGVHPLDLHQRRVLVLVRLRPLVSEDGAADVEPHALPGASLHHLVVAAALKYIISPFDIPPGMDRHIINTKTTVLYYLLVFF
jgi:hypothetical protein